MGRRGKRLEEVAWCLHFTEVGHYQRESAPQRPPLQRKMERYESWLRDPSTPLWLKTEGRHLLGDSNLDILLDFVRLEPEVQKKAITRGYPGLIEALDRMNQMVDWVYQEREKRERKVRRRQRGNMDLEWEEPERPAPEWEEPERPAPEWEEPERPAPEWEEPERPAPEWEEPERPAPEWEEPERPAPEWEEPERPAPEWEEPERPAPEWEEPERPAPEWEEPKRPAPEWEEPERPAPKRGESVRPQPKRGKAKGPQPRYLPAEGEFLLVTPPPPWEDNVLLPPPPAEGEFLLVPPPSPCEDDVSLPPPPAEGEYLLVPPPPPWEDCESLPPPPAEGEYLLVPPPPPWEDCVSLQPPPAESEFLLVPKPCRLRSPKGRKPCRLRSPKGRKPCRLRSPKGRKRFSIGRLKERKPCRLRSPKGRKPCRLGSPKGRKPCRLRSPKGRNQAPSGRGTVLRTGRSISVGLSWGGFVFSWGIAASRRKTGYPESEASGGEVPTPASTISEAINTPAMASEETASPVSTAIAVTESVVIPSTSGALTGPVTSDGDSAIQLESGGNDIQGQWVGDSIEAEGGEEAGSSTEGVAARAAAEETETGLKEIGEIREEIAQMETEKEKGGDFKIPGKKRTRKRSGGLVAKKHNTEAEEGGIGGVGTGVKEREAEGKDVEERRPATRWSVLAASSVTEESESEREGGLTGLSLAAESSGSQSGSGPAGGYELEKKKRLETRFLRCYNDVGPSPTKDLWGIIAMSDPVRQWTAKG
ncbi:UNVERIFIED_CONTAM: hypothetical protein FKN15_068923 [Acipenser sinensis]